MCEIASMNLHNVYNFFFSFFSGAFLSQLWFVFYGLYFRLGVLWKKKPKPVTYGIPLQVYANDINVYNITI